MRETSSLASVGEKTNEAQPGHQRLIAGALRSTSVDLTLMYKPARQAELCPNGAAFDDDGGRFGRIVAPGRR